MNIDGIDVAKASDFMAMHARPLDRRRFELLTGQGDRAALLAALNAYRNPDGGYGWGLEPDLRSRTSQPGPALHAFEVFLELAREDPGRPGGRAASVDAEDAQATTDGGLGRAAERRPSAGAEGAQDASRYAVALCDWLESVTLPDGGLPFALPVPDPAGCAPFWASADPDASSLQITAIVAATARRVADHDPAVAAHPWLERAIGFCRDAARATAEPHALELAFALRLADAADDGELIEVLGRHIPESGMVHVAGGLADEAMRPLDFAPDPDRPVRSLFAPEVIAAELRKLADGQRDDGGWRVDFASYSPAAELEWRGYSTVGAVSTLLRNAGSAFG
ncbi:hypothetical protein BJF79_45425 [Actinomadura sp. CNU-125]|uniref:hypothetical protein n=1 Tax=Actinomadura sp. CNU-125 TaxID=1904961 RepID=UPI000969926B|nr:hypothetical protein [Actinomadura sp. CNU-125]OLT24097.1 hypothetical protein BJF79_45425 [Actinomadura sp. CNU-125]